MRSNKLSHACVVAFLSVLATSTSLAAQEEPAKHHHYKLIDLGTFGGPTSAIGSLVVSLNNRGMATSCADTSSLDPNYPNINAIWVQDPFIQHAFRGDEEGLDDLGTLPGGTSSCGGFINRKGQISGYSTNGETDILLGTPAVHAALWYHGNISDLGTFGGYESVAYGINDAGVVVGGATNTISDPDTASYFNFFIQAATQVHAFLWKDGTLHDIRTLGTGTDSVAFYVNDKGQVAGQSFTDTTVNASTGLPTMHPFLWENGKMKDLGTLGGTLVTTLAALNGRGEVVGSMTLKGDLQGAPDGYTRHPFLWDGHAMRDLKTLGGTSADAEWLNDDGVVVGASWTAGDQAYQPFVWKNGVMTGLTPLSGDCCGNSIGINASGQVVGNSFGNSAGTSRAFLWENNGPPIDLQTLVQPNSDIALTEAVFINDRGEIAVNGVTSNGDRHALLLIPCDEDLAEVEGCDYRSVDATTAAQVRAAQATQSSTVANENHDRPMRLRGRLDGRLLHWRDSSGVRSPNK